MPELTINQKKAVTIDENKNILVSAGAGSGKTSVITERIIQKLKNGKSINDLLILTFTNAAALEMKQRIYKAIKKEKNLKHELELINTADIMTFDAYYLKLLKQYGYKLDISKNLILENQIILKDILNDAILEILNEEYEKKDPTFLKYLEKYTVFDDDTFKENLVSLYYEYEKVLDKNKLNSKVEEAVEKYIYELKEKYQEINTLLSEMKKIPTDQKGEEYIQKLTDYYFPFINFSSYNSLIKSLKERGSAPKISKFEGKEQINSKKKQIKSIFDELQKITVLKSKENIIKDENSLKGIKQFILTLLERIAQVVLKKKKDLGVFSYSDVNALAFEIIQTHDEIRDNLKNKYVEIIVDEYQDTNDFQNEFINLISNNNLFLVGDIKQSIYGFRNANPKNFQEMIEKYSFSAEGEVISLLDNFRSREEVLKSLNSMFQTMMTENLGNIDYKNQHGLNFGNMKYNKKSAQNYFLEIIDYSKKEISKLIKDSSKLTELERKKFKKKIIEPFIIVKDIQEKIKNKYQILDLENGKFRAAKYNDFTILTLKKSSYYLYQEVFDFFNIPLDVQEDLVFDNYENHELFVLKNILEMIIKNKENNSLGEISLLRSYLYEVDANTIYRYVEGSLDANQIVEVQDIKSKIQRLKKEQYSSIEYLVNGIIAIFGVVNKSSRLNESKGFLERINRIYETAAEFDNLGKNRFEYLEYLNEVIESEKKIGLVADKEKISAVHLMTIHKSKGLEFPIVYIAGLGERKGKDSNNLITLDTNYGLVLPKIDNYIKENTFLYYFLKEEKRIEELNELIRVLYVAVTRAKEKVLIVNDLEEKKDIILTSKVSGITNLSQLINKFLSQSSYQRKYSLISEEEYQAFNFFKLEYPEIIVKPDNSKIKFCYKELQLEKSSFLLGSASLKLDTVLSKEENKNRNLGTKLHKVLEFYDLFNLKNLIIKEEDERKKEIKKDLKQYVDILKNEENILIDALENFLKLNVFKSLIKYYTEYEFQMVEQNKEYNGIIDLILEDNKQMIIIDYKLKNINKDEYQKQLKLYMKYLQSKTDKDVSGYLYSLVDRQFSPKIKL